MDEMIQYIKERIFANQADMIDAQNDVPIEEDEHYESDDYYYGAVQALEDVLKKFGENV